MNKEQQDKIWNELSEESKEKVLARYNEAKYYNDTKDIDCYEDLFGEHNLNLKPLTYYDIEKEVCDIKGANYQKWVNKESAINKLLVVAKYLNEDWKPDWSDEGNEFYTLGIDPDDNSIKVIQVNTWRVSTEIVYFRTEELAKQAIQILGEETIRLALTTDY